MLTTQYVKQPGFTISVFSPRDDRDIFQDDIARTQRAERSGRFNEHE